jgi:acyl-CoA thioester hydrolase
LAKPDPALLSPARYPFHTDIDFRFGDLDVKRHVNNVSLANFIEEGRVRFHRASGFQTSIEDLRAMVVSISTEFIGEAFYPGTITAHCGASRIGKSSYDLELLLCQDDRVVLFARSVMVCMKGGKPFAIPDSFRESVADWMVRA